MPSVIACRNGKTKQIKVVSLGQQCLRRILWNFRAFSYSCHQNHTLLCLSVAFDQKGQEASYSTIKGMEYPRCCHCSHQQLTAMRSKLCHFSTSLCFSIILMEGFLRIAIQQIWRIPDYGRLVCNKIVVLAQADGKPEILQVCFKATRL